MRGLPWQAKVYLVAVICAAALLFARSLFLAGRLINPDLYGTLLVLALLFLVCESMPTLLNVEHFAVSVSFSAALAAVVLVGPEGAALVGLTATLSVRPGLPLVKRMFNGSQFAICGYAAGWAYTYTGGVSGVPKVNAFEALIGPYAAAAAVFIPVNMVLTLTMIWLATRVKAEEVPLKGMAQFLFSYFGYAGMLHDVGKLGVPTKVLQKDGPLTEEEFAAIQLHPMRGLEIVRGIDFLDEAFAGIMHHHERHDGKGYPMGLAGDEIPEFARVIAVADAFDSMTSDRSYRGARTVEVAVAELRKGAGTQFDPEMVTAFIRALDRDPWQPPRMVASVPADATGTAAKDHDDPTMPIQVVGGQ